MAKTKTATSWNLDHIVSLKDWPKLHVEIEADLAMVEKWWQKMSPDMATKDFAAFAKWEDALGEKISRLYCRGYLWEAADQKSSEAKNLKNKAHDLAVKASNATTKISHWLKGLTVPGKKILDDKNAKRLFASVPDLEYVLSYNRLAAKHTLSEAEETLATEKDAVGRSALIDLREMIETEFSFDLKLSGKKTVTIGNLAELKQYVYSEKPAWRRAAYEALLNKYAENEDKFFLIYQSIVKNWCAMAKRRGFKSSIAARNFVNHLPDRAIEVLLTTVGANRAVFQDFFKYKARALGVKKLSRFDLYAPLEKLNKKTDYVEAVGMVFNVFEKFSSNFAAHAKKVIAENHVDVWPADTKHGGAFCSTVGPSLTPYMLLNYVGTGRDVSTLAHELGHAVHSLYADHHYLGSQAANLPLCETASTMAELLLFEELLVKAKTKKEKQLMLADRLGNSFATILRQAYFTQFELQAHEAIVAGATAADLGKLWLATLKEQFGSTVEVDPLFAKEWMYIPHIVNEPFYCYSYVFGELLSLALYARYKKEGQSFVPKIEKILASGGSESPDKILKEVGIDMADPKFWQGSFDIIKEWVKELKAK